MDTPSIGPSNGERVGVGEWTERVDGVNESVGRMDQWGEGSEG